MSTWFTAWNYDLLWALVCGFLAFFYLAGVWRLRRRGDRWPVHRTVLWLAGIALLFYVTNGPLNVYQDYLFSIHMLAHMLLAMVIPLLLVPGAPITLAMRAIHKRDDGSRGAREWIMLIVHSRYMRVLDEPGRGRRDLRRLAVGVLLHPAVQLGGDRPHRALLDDRALPGERLPVRDEPDRRRPARPTAPRTRSGC